MLLRCYKEQTGAVIPLCISHPVQIGVRIFWHVVVEDDIDPLDVHPSAKEISGHQDPPLEVFELLIARQPMEQEGAGVRTEPEIIINTAAVSITGLNPSLKAVMC